MKIMLICEHLSTGGMPAYVLKMVETLKKQNGLELVVVETNNLSNDYVVQRNKLQKLVPLIQVESKLDLLTKAIKDLKPDVIHFQEVPEKFTINDGPNGDGRPMPHDFLAKIYSTKRPYNILVTSHSSLTRREHFAFIPDRFVTVSKWQQDLFKQEFPGAEVDIWEYPITSKPVSKADKRAAKQRLGWNLNRKHILNVGLFTPGKNQGELFEVAMKNPQNTYHFVGNLAPNFQFYWQNLVNNRPKNVAIWGEREDVDTFYKAADEFYFTSRFELCPLVVKEALGYGLPTKLYKLPTYGEDYDKNPLVKYLTPAKSTI